MQLTSLHAASAVRLHGVRKPDDMPLVGRIMREKKGVYICIISFKQSRRHYGDEYIYAPNIKAVKLHLVRMYPTLTFRR